MIWSLSRTEEDSLDLVSWKRFNNLCAVCWQNEEKSAQQHKSVRSSTNVWSHSNKWLGDIDFTLARPLIRKLHSTNAVSIHHCSTGDTPLTALDFTMLVLRMKTNFHWLSSLIHQQAKLLVDRLIFRGHTTKMQPRLLVGSLYTHASSIIFKYDPSDPFYSLSWIRWGRFQNLLLVSLKVMDKKSSEILVLSRRKYQQGNRDFDKTFSIAS